MPDVFQFQATGGETEVFRSDDDEATPLVLIPFPDGQTIETHQALVRLVVDGMNALSEPQSLEDAFAREWANPPAPFNPAFDPKAKDRYAAVTASMEADGFYADHTREECKAEWGRRYDAEKAAGR